MRFSIFLLTTTVMVSTPLHAMAADAAAGEAKFKQLCASCHGPAGKGDGPAAAALRPKPRDFSSGDWQDSVDDDHLRTVITKGGAAVGKSPMMAPFGGALKEQQVEDIIAYIRSLGE